jgi:hypothetical protein
MIASENNHTKSSTLHGDDHKLIETYQEKIDFLNSGLVDPFVVERICADAPFRLGKSPAGSSKHQAFCRACQRYYEEKIRVLEAEPS